MSDETLDQLALRAIDGDNDVLKRAETDPDLAASIAAQQHIRAALSHPVPGPRDDVRELHLAAALSAFDEIHRTGATEVEPSNVVPLSRARRGRWLAATAAAALIVVGLVGIANLQRSPSDDFADGPAAEALNSDDASAAVETTMAQTQRAAEPSVGAEESTAAATEFADSAETAETMAAPAGDSLAFNESGMVEFGPVDERFVACLDQLELPDRPYSASRVLFEDVDVLQIEVLDDFDTVTFVEFNPTTCALIGVVAAE